ncbi:hypothetical protein [uncultured Treponema sp.]|uniref:hypothetical protein n=1 Tax=uncultured Treponema sp. TaxID=162155 RepID=UPI0025D431DE|nr:hypothetical protein [uncultured Treponema sp.]
MSAAIDSVKNAYIQSHNIPQKKLATGDEVSVKVIKSLGNGNYAIFLQGSKINVKSKIPLSEGSSFKAMLEIESDSKIILKTIYEQKTEDLFPRTLLEFLNSAGIEADSVALKVVQQMIQSGVKLDKSIIRKAKSVSSLFPEKEKQAAEISAMLLEKGIEPEEKLIEKFLILTEPDKWKNSGVKEKSSSKSSENFLKKIYQEIPENKDGILTLANHLKLKEGTGKHWVILPFLWQLEKDEAKGLIRILVDFNKKITEKIQINCEFEWKKFFFVLYLNKSKVTEVRFCTLPSLLTSNIHSEEERLGELLCSGMNGDSVTVTYSALAFSDSLCTDSEISLPFKDSAV